MVKSDKKKIGIFGGTFNPIHHGHLVNIELIKENFNLDFIIFIPVKIPVHKIISDPVDSSERFEMIRLAISGIDYFQVSDIELKRKSPSYTITTLEELNKIYPEDTLFLIIGSDSFNELDTWKEYKKILSDYNLIVMMRPGDTVLRQDLLNIAGKIEVQHESLIEISSSGIRERIKKDLPIRYLTTDDVIKYIGEKGMYKIG